MDRKQEELQFVGLFGIYREAYKITASWRKIFLLITLSTILPLSFIYLAQIQISELVITKINDNSHTLEETRIGNRMYKKTVKRMLSELIAFSVFKAIYLLVLLIFSLLSTSAVVYTIGCIYTSTQITFKKVISVVPKIWKRLVITLLWNAFILSLYNLLAILLIFVFTIVLAVLVDIGMIRPDGKLLMVYDIVFLIILSIPYLIGLVYISVVWHLASVISVLEESYGFKALKKSKNLIKGKIWLASVIFVKLQIFIGVILMLFSKLVVHGGSIGTVSRLSLGILCFLLLTILIHFALVIQTIIYFVCKSHHNENINKSSLADRLNVYHQVDYVRLTKDDTDMQSEQFSV